MNETAKPKRHAPKGRIKADPSKGAPVEPPRCTAHSSGTGKPCRRFPIAGGTVCPTHGGSAPQVQMKAAERLLAMQPAALTRLDQLVNQTEYPSVAIAAVKDVLDRTIGKALERTEVGLPGQFSQLSNDALKAKIEEMQARLGIIAKFLP